MPCLKIFTNVCDSAIPKDFIAKLVAALSNTLNKPNEPCMVMISADNVMYMPENEYAPTVFATLESVGYLGPKQTKVIAKELSECLAKELQMEMSNIFLTFYNMEPHNVAKNGETME